ncbi:cytochrome c biogenesis protein CcsA [Candidatus Desantisbacteria bacterium]|nr:cytochrome c biogenesis protein CcsA [Candidatus Desantisbacteria bacterium]
MHSSPFFIIALIAYGLSSLLYLTQNRWGTSAAIAGVIIQTIGLVIRTVEAHHLPFANLYESILFFSLSIVFLWLIVGKRYKIRIVSASALLIGFIVLLLGLFLPSGYKSSTPLMPALQSHWLEFHVATCFLGYAAFALAFGISVVYLFLKEDTAILEEITYKSITIGFIFLTIGIISGAVWAKYAWGRCWSWDPKETWALITWLIYALYFHLRTIGWRKKKSAWIAIIGFLAVIFTYLGVTFLLPGLHSYM